MADLVAILSAAGLTVDDHRRSPAPGSFTPCGIVLHHTVSRPSSNPVPSLNVVLRGRSDVPGPLCNLLLGRDAKFRAITDGRANDTGSGSRVVLDEARAGQVSVLDARQRGLASDTNGNPYFYDIEVENDGTGESYSDLMIDVLARGTAALLQHHGWGIGRVLHHRTWTPRKIDMSYRGDIKGLIKNYLTPILPPVPAPIFYPEAPKMRVDVVVRVGKDGTGFQPMNVHWSRFRSATPMGFNPFTVGHVSTPHVAVARHVDDNTLILLSGALPGDWTVVCEVSEE